jgi:ketosteroid isomerase-like protein
MAGEPAIGGRDAIYTMRNGKVVLAEEYFDRAEALEAVGLRE